MIIKTIEFILFINDPFLSSGMASMQQQQFQKSFGQQQTVFQQQQQQVQHQQVQHFDQQHHGEEIQQQSLKSTLQSAITDIEEQIEGADFEADKENVPQQQGPMPFKTFYAISDGAVNCNG